MPNLRIIKFFDSTFSGKGAKLVLLNRGLKSLPNESRYFQWEYCALKNLPSSFCPENLVELRLSNSNFEQLWNGDQVFFNIYLHKKLIFIHFIFHFYNTLSLEALN